jgi:hypothetical protein
MTEHEFKVYLMVVDKGLLALIVVGAGYLLNRALETFKSERALQLEMAKLGTSKDLAYVEQQLSELYWPLYTYLEVDRALWMKVDELQGGDENDALLADRIQDEYIVPNDEEILKLVKTKNQLSETDSDGIEIAKRFIREAVVFKLRRAIAKDSAQPSRPVRDESLRFDFYRHVTDTAWDVQERHERLRASMRSQRVPA